MFHFLFDNFVFLVRWMVTFTGLWQPKIDIVNKKMPGIPHGSKQVKLILAQFVGWLGMTGSEMCKLLFYKDTEFRADGNYWGNTLFQGENMTRFACLPHPLFYIRQWDVSYTDISSFPDSKVPMIVLLSSLLWLELGTNQLISPVCGPDEWLSFLCKTSKKIWFQFVGKVHEMAPA